MFKVMLPWLCLFPHKTLKIDFPITTGLIIIFCNFRNDIEKNKMWYSRKNVVFKYSSKNVIQVKNIKQNANKVYIFALQ